LWWFLPASYLVWKPQPGADGAEVFFHTEKDRGRGTGPAALGNPAVLATVRIRMRRFILSLTPILALLASGCQPSDARAADTDPRNQPGTVPVRVDKLVAIFDQSFARELATEPEANSPTHSLVTHFIGGVTDLGGTLTVNSQPVLRQVVLPLSALGSPSKGIVVAGVFAQTEALPPKWVTLEYKTKNATLTAESLSSTDAPRPRVRYASAEGMMSVPEKPVLLQTADLSSRANPDPADPKLIALYREGDKMTGYYRKSP